MKISIREYAEKVLPLEFRMELMDIEAACLSIGWQYVDNPECCGHPLHIDSFIGAPYLAFCDICGRFVYDVTGPRWGNSWVNVINSDMVDMKTNFETRWISGIKALARVE